MIKSNFKIVHNLEINQWREYVDNHPFGNIFHTPEMFQVFAQTKYHQPTLWAILDVNTEKVLAMLLPVKITMFDGWLRYLTSRAVVYGSLLYELAPPGQEALIRMLHAYTKKTDKSILFTELRNLSDMTDVQSLLNNSGFIYEDHLNYLIDLNRPPDEIMQSIGKRTRKQIRRGLRRKTVTIQEAINQEQLDICYDLLRKTYANAQVPLADYSLFENAFKILHPKNMIRILLAYVEDVPAAVSVELLYKSVIYGWYGGIDRDYSSHTPNELLMWHILKWGAENGYTLYDFGGAGKPDEKYGVRDFKAKFGGDLVCYGRNICVHSPLRLLLSKRGYAIYRAIGSR